MRSGRVLMCGLMFENRPYLISNARFRPVLHVVRYKAAELMNCSIPIERAIWADDGRASRIDVTINRIYKARRKLLCQSQYIAPSSAPNLLADLIFRACPKAAGRIIHRFCLKKRLTINTARLGKRS